jgi:hypothetical protein
VALVVRAAQLSRWAGAARIALEITVAERRIETTDEQKCSGD